MSSRGRFFFWSRKRRRAGAFFLEQKKGGVLGVFFWSRKFAAAVLFAAENFIQPIFPAIRERLICAVAVKGNFFEDSFRVRYSSICLDLRLDLPIILFTIFG